MSQATEGIAGAVAKLLADCPVQVVCPVWWADLDAFQHVNNTVYFRFFEHVRLAYLDKVGWRASMEAAGIGPILAETDCRFRIPLSYPDTVTIGTHVDEVSDTGYLMHYRVVSHQHEKVAAEGTGRMVSFDYRNNAKAPIPDSVRKKMDAL